MVNYDSLLEKVQTATNAHLPDMAYTYLTYVLVVAARDLARKYDISFKERTDRGLFRDLGFKGVLPETLMQNCLSVLSIRDDLLHTLAESGKPSETDLQHLLQLCEQLRELL